MKKSLVLILSIALFLGLGVRSGPRSGMNLPHDCSTPGGVISEQHLQCLYDLKEFGNVPAELQRADYHFSSYTGSDSNAGDVLNPLRSWEKVKDVCLDGTHCKLAAGEVWSESLITNFTLNASTDCNQYIANSHNPHDTAIRYLNLIDNTIDATETNEDDYIVSAASAAHTLRVDVDTAPGATKDDWVVTLMDDGVATSVTCTIADAATNCSDALNIASVAAGSDMTLKIDPTTGSTTVLDAAGQLRSSVCISGEIREPIIGETIEYDAPGVETVKEIYNDGSDADTFTMTYGANTTGALDWDSDADEVETALEGLASVTDVEVRGNGRSYSPWVVSFVNPKTDASAFSIADTGMTSTLTEEEATARIIDYRPELEIIALRILKGRHQLADDDDNIRGLTSGASISIDASGITNTLAPNGDATAQFAPSCSDDDDLCILISGDYEDPPIIDCGLEIPDAATGPIMGVGGASATGWVGVQNLIIQDCVGDSLSAQNAGNIGALNVQAVDVRNISGAEDASNSFTNHGDGNMFSINGIFDTHQDYADGTPSGAPLQFVSDSDNSAKTTLIGRSTIINDTSGSYNDGSGGSVYQTAGGDITIVGHGLRGIQNSDSNTITGFEINASNNVDAYLCRVTVESVGANTSAVRVGALSDANDSIVNVKMWEVTITGVVGLTILYADDDSGSQVTGRGIMIHDVSSYAVKDNLQQADDFAIDIEGIYWPDEGSWGHCGGDSSATLTQCRTALEANSASSIFNTNSESPTHAPWDDDDGTGTLPNFVTHPNCGGGSCNAIGFYTCTLAQSLPKFVLPGQQSVITGILMDGKIGGR